LGLISGQTDGLVCRRFLNRYLGCRERSERVTTSPARRLLTTLLQQDLAQVDFGVRRFRLRPGNARGILEQAGRSFLEGFNAAVSMPVGDELTAAVNELDEPMHGFAYEGAGMACALLDIVGFTGGRNLRRLLAGPAVAYPHLVHVGAGWAFARLRSRPGWGRPVLDDPLLRWLAWDGYGFHQGFLRPDRVVAGQVVESGLTADQRAIRDQGLGRSLWFHECADPESVALRIGEFHPARRGDLWSGVGLAATYAGGAEPDELLLLNSLSGRRRADVAQGAAFACAAREISGVVPAHTKAAATILAGAPAHEAAAWTRKALSTLVQPATTSQHYQQWRAGIRSLWVDSTKGLHTWS
jgi:hypothetical protein